MKKIITNFMFLFTLTFVMLAMNGQIIYAAGFEDDKALNPEEYEYNIMEYKLILNENYSLTEGENRDFICSSGVIESEKKCDTKNDATVHVYPAWKVLNGLKPYTTKANFLSSTNRTFFFDTGAWDTLKNGEGWTGTRENLQYIMVYLHRVPFGVELFQKTRSYRYYSPGNVVDNLSPELIKGSTKERARYQLVALNGEFVAPSQRLLYTTVPHVLGSEGDGTVYKGTSQGGIVGAVMEEVTGRPVPVYFDGSNTGFFEIRETGQDFNNMSDNEIVTYLKSKYLANFNKTKFEDATQDDFLKASDLKDSGGGVYEPFTAYDANGNKYQIDERGELLKLIKAMGGPQFVGSVKIGLSEAITQRTSTYQFMSAMGNNGNYVFNTRLGNQYVENDSKKSYGVMNLKPRNTYLYLYAGNGNEDSVITRIAQRGTSSNSNISLNSGLTGSAENANFKVSLLTLLRGSYTGKDIKFFNYYNDVEPYTFSYGGTDYKGFVLKPRNSEGKSNSGVSTMYYNNGKDERQDFTWGTWRQVGWTVENQESAGGFPYDTMHFPNPGEITLDWSNTANTCEGAKNCNHNIIRYPWTHNGGRSYKETPEFSKAYLNAYILKSSGKEADLDIKKSFKYYDEMTDTLMKYVRTYPDFLYRLFYMAEDINYGRLENSERCDNGLSIGHSPISNISLANIESVDEYYYCYPGLNQIQWNKPDGSKTGPVDSKRLEKIAKALCENISSDKRSCGESVESFYNAVMEGNNPEYSISSLAIADALKIKDGNTTYMEDLAYIMYNYYALVAFPDELSMGQVFSTRRDPMAPGNTGYSFYAYDPVLSIDASNVGLLNEEARLGDSLTGTIKEGKPDGTEISSVTKEIGKKYGAEIYLINQSTGEVYSPVNPDAQCPAGYTRVGDNCTRTVSTSINTTCKTGYSFDWNTFKCIENSIGLPTCDAGFVLVNGKCETYHGTTPICGDGHWDPIDKMCKAYAEAKCSNGYTLKDLDEDKKLTFAGGWDFTSASGDVNKFKGYGIKDLKQSGSSEISYNIDNNSDSNISIEGLNIAAANASHIQIRVMNDSSGAIGQIYYKTNTSPMFDHGKVVNFNMETDNDGIYYTYTIDMTGGKWADTVTGLRFELANGTNGGTIIIDYIKYGNVKNGYVPNYKCVKNITPTCASGFTLIGSRCYGFASSLTTFPTSYEFDCGHVTLKSNEKVSLASFKIGDAVDFTNVGQYKVFSAPVSGTYYFEVWGASNTSSTGGYSAGLKTLNAGDRVYIHIGAQNATTISRMSVNGFTDENTVVMAQAGNGFANPSTSTYKIVTAPGGLMKRTTDIGNSTWVGENGHSGNGHGRITLYSANNQTVGVTAKTKSFNYSDTKTYGYTGTVQTFDVPVTGTYTLEVWGAQGGTNNNAGGNGGYSKGTATLTGGSRLHIFVGGAGGNGRNTTYDGGYNGGGYGHGYGGGGGGMTFMSTSSSATAAPSSQYANGGTWNSTGTLIVAGGGGGSGPAIGGAGGGTTGGTGGQACGSSGGGGSQTSGGYAGGYCGTMGGHGFGGSNTCGNSSGGGGGGGGYYGGGGGGNDYYDNWNDNDDSGGGGGSGYIGGVVGGTMQAGVKTGHGQAVISYNMTGTTTLGYYFSVPSTARTIGACLVSDKSVTLNGYGMGLYVNNGQTNVCGMPEYKDEVATYAPPSSFGYTGTIQKYVAPVSGTYTFEAWGAEGATAGTGLGAKGGYSKGNYYLTAGQEIYIVVGGQGSRYNGGYNGGGSSNSYGGGGGATHIATRTGLLSALSSYRSNVLIVAGGGGGAGHTGDGGAGGGINGTNGYSASGSYGIGGTQTSAGYGAGFGFGGVDYRHGGGGGGGYFGGAGGGNDCEDGGGGGSGYTGALSNATMQNGVRSGNGYVTITPPSSGIIGGLTQPQVFNYTGGMQSVTLQPGKYKLEVWGGQGGSGYNSSYGGAGGYAVGEVTFTSPTTLYIGVGGQGIPSSGSYWTKVPVGGFNGGGNGNGDSGAWGGAGGGATHIATRNGVLSSLVNNKNDVLIVAGGGGGGGHGTHGGAGGGLSGAYGTSYASVGTQTGGYAFGQGGSSYGHDMGAGGGGWYGAYDSRVSDASAGGGSSYIGGVTNGSTTTGQNSGNGIAKITMLDNGNITKSSGVCSLEARLRILPICPNGTTYDAATNKCYSSLNPICASGYTWNATIGQCTKSVMPNSCSNNGTLYVDAPGWGCKIVTNPNCQVGYTYKDGACRKNTVLEYTPNLCSNGYELQGKKCVKTIVEPLAQMSKESLSGENQVVELDKLYMLKNYSYYKASSERGLYFAVADEEGKYSYVRSAMFPNIELDLSLVDKKISPTSVCRAEGGTDCDKLPAYKEYKISLDNIKIYEGNINKKGGKEYSSTNPDCVNIADSQHVACRYLWSEYNPTNREFVMNNSFEALYSEVDVYFMFKETEFCYANAVQGATVSVNDLTCKPYKADKDNYFTKTKDGVVKLDVNEIDGEYNINTLFLRSTVVSPKKSNGHDIKVKDAYLYIDNSIYRDDTSVLITGFKPSPDADVFIDRIEIWDAKDNKAVLVADAMTKNRCLNGYEIETGITALFTQSVSNLPYDNGADKGEGKTDCVAFDPSSQIMKLETDRNYYVKAYTKYISIDEKAIIANTPARYKYVALDLKHTGNYNSIGVYQSITTALKTMDSDATYSVKSGKFANSGNNVAAQNIVHNNILKFDILDKFITKEVSETNFNVGNTNLTSIRNHYAPNTYALSVVDPMSSLVIPANGLAAKGLTSGLLDINVSGESSMINAYSTWDRFPFRYSLGDGVDVESKPVLKCVTTTGQTVELTEKTGMCVYVNSNTYKDCKLFARVTLHKGEQEVSSNIKVHVTNDLNTQLNAVGKGTLYPSTTKLTTASTTSNTVDILIRNVANTERSIYAETTHTSVDNNGYIDVDWSNNTGNNCWIFDGVDYAVTNLQVSPEMIKPNVDAEGKPLKTTKTVNLTGSYDITKVYDYTGNKNVPITYKLKDAKGNVYACTNPNPTAKLVTVGSMEKVNVPFTLSCGINFNTLKAGDNLELIVAINGGKTGTRQFNEMDYTNNETSATIFTSDVPTDYKCDNTCVTTNRWFVNFDFVYTFNRSVVSYQTGTSTNMTWTDYRVGVKSGATQDLTYSAPIASGNINRAPDDYMAYRSHTTEKNSKLCTDYKAGFSECWRFEYNVNHNITYYRYSSAVTSTYATHQTLGGPSGTCSPSNATFNGSETYGASNAGLNGSNHTWSNSNTSSGIIGGCHGYTQSPQKQNCPTVTDWWGNTICDSSAQVYSVNASSGSFPSNYIPYEYFQDYTISDNAGVSPTTKTDRVVLKSQVTYTNKNQGAAHPGWVQQRTVDVCTLKTYKSVSYYCPSGFRYGTPGGAYTTSANSRGSLTCAGGTWSNSTRTCTWTDASKSPTTENYWPAIKTNTCYRQHYDWRCGSYDGVSPNVSQYNESSAGQMCHYTSSSSRFWSSGVSGCTYMKMKPGESCSICGQTCTGGYDSYGNCGGWTCNTCNFLQPEPGEYAWKSCDGAWSGYTSTSCGPSAGSAPTPTCRTSNTVNRSRNCQGNDVSEGTDYCYERANEILNTSDYRCVQWRKQAYQEIKYYTTSSPVNVPPFITRTYKDSAKIWQYTCNTGTPTVPYPTDGNFIMQYNESITTKVEVKTERSGGWITLQEKNNPKEANPRGGEWFELRATTVYNTSRANKPSTMPYLTDYYNNYHNINTYGVNAPQYDTTYPVGGYPHYGLNDTGKTVVGDGKQVRPSSGADIVNNSDYGFCDARPAEPYGSAYRAGSWQFAPTNKNNVNEQQGHTDAAWTTNIGGNGTVFFGPDNKTVWKKDTFGNDYGAIVEICPSTEPDCTEQNSFIRSFLEETSGSCTSYYNGLCATYTRTWLPTENLDATGVRHRGFYIPTDMETQTANIQVSTSKFQAVGQYEKELIGNPLSTNNTDKFLSEVAGAPIKPLCNCKSYEIITKDGEHGWATSEWEVE